METTEDSVTLETDPVMEKIEEHLRSIRSMLKFFTIVVALAIVVQACSAILSV